MMPLFSSQHVCEYIVVSLVCYVLFLFKICFFYFCFAFWFGFVRVIGRQQLSSSLFNSLFFKQQIDRALFLRKEEFTSMLSFHKKKVCNNSTHFASRIYNY